MTLIDSLWDGLRRIRACKFVTRSNSIRVTGWSGSGSGAVAVEEPSATVLIFRESGIWRPDTGRDLHFRNAYRWTRQDEAIRLEHLRFGDENPVYLFDLAPTSDGTWVSLTPHLCRDDTYTARLRQESHSLFLAWTVAGPEKDEEIEYTYSSYGPSDQA